MFAQYCDNVQRHCLTSWGRRAGALEVRLLKQIFHDETSARLELLGRISDAEGSLVRTFFSPAHIRAASQVRTCVLLTRLSTDSYGTDHFWHNQQSRFGIHTD